MNTSSWKILLGRLTNTSWRLHIAGLVLGCVVGAALYYGITAYFIHEAESRVLDLLLQNRALHQYIQRNTHPALYEMKAEGVIDSSFYSAELLSSSYMARHVTKYLNEERHRYGLPAVGYRIAAIDPRNPTNAADDADRQLIDLFNADREMTSYRKIIATDSGKYLQVTLPFLETGEACLRCHGTAAAAPRGLVDRYGTEAGFNAEPGQIRAFESIVAPLSTDILQARILFLAVLVALISMSGLVFVVSGLRRKVHRRTAELAASELKHRSLVEDLPCFVCSFLPDGSITFVNRLLARYFDTEPERLVGKNIKEVVRPDVLDEAANTFQRLTPDKPIGVKELKVVNRDGSTRWHCWTFRGSFDADGKVVLYQTFGEDITERRQASEIIKESEARFSTIFHASPIGISISRMDDGYFVDANQALLTLLGFEREELVGHSSLELDIYPDCAERARLISLLREQNRIRGIDTKLRAKWGSIQEMMVSAEIIQLDGRPHMLASVMDVSEWKRAERALRESEERQRALLNAIPDNILLLDSRGDMIDFHGGGSGSEFPIRQLFGSSLDEVPIPPAVREEIRRGITEVIATGEPRQYEHELLTPQGRRMVEARFAKCSDTTVLLLLRNVTARKEAEEALRKSEQSYRTLSENLPGMVYRVHLREKNRFEFFNDWAARITGYSMEELNNDDRCAIPMLMHPDDRPAVEKTVREAVWDQKPYSIYYRLTHRDGNVRHVLERSTVVPGVDGLPLYIDGVIFDLTDQVHANEALRQSEEKYRSYVDNAPDAVMVVDREGRLVEINPAAGRMTGYSRDELLGKSISDLLSADANEAIRNSFPAMDSGLEKRGDVAVRCKNGGQVWWSVDGVRLSDDRYLAFCVDITETRRLRELESRAQRLETAGRIAGQVAHDFNNLLGPLTAYPDMIREDLPRDHPALAYLNSIEESAHQIADINQQLLALGRRGHYNQEPMNLNEIVHLVLKQIDAVPESLTVETALASDLMPMMGGHSQILRVLMNLVQNAREAMLDAGQLTIQTENFYFDGLTTAFAHVPRGEYVKLTVSDTGCGIPQEIIENVFDPFFTTKKADRKRGSGLGLSVVEAVVNDHRGYIDLSSSVGEGTSVYLYFPITREHIGNAPVEVVVGGTETILVVDDDQVQREVCLQILARLGYQAEAVSGGEEALARLREASFDLLVLDMIMPSGLDGAETYRRALDISPQQRAIMLSGFAESDRVIEAQRIGAGAFLRKPVTRNILARAVRRELDRTVVILANA